MQRGWELGGNLAEQANNNRGRAICSIAVEFLLAADDK